MGWYHTHPGHTAYYSVTDIATHRRNFSKPHQVGIVIDPLHEDMGVYGLREGGYVEKAFIIVNDGEFVEERFDIPPQEEEEEPEEFEFGDEEMEFEMEEAAEEEFEVEEELEPDADEEEEYKAEENISLENGDGG